jgi:DNA-binding NarL/FixJ family response regulator
MRWKKSRKGVRMAIKIAVAEHDTMFRDGICSLIGRHSNMKIVSEVRNGKIVMNKVRQSLPDVLIINTDMPDLNGIDLMHEINAEFPNVKVIAMSADIELKFIMEIFKAGASGYLRKNCSHNDIKRAIDIVVENKTYLSDEVSTLMSAFFRLTKREREIFGFISEGRSIREIASHLNISSKAIESYRRNVLKKLNIPNTVAITKYAICEGLITI